MSSFRRRRRAGAHVLVGRKRAEYLAARLGIALREARLAGHLKQSELATATLLSQPEISRLERGYGLTASIETWAIVAAAAGSQLAAFLEELPAATRPRDYEHLRRQQLVMKIGAAGGWRAKSEHRIDRGSDRSRSIDVVLERAVSRETAVVEVWDWFGDVGAAWRGFDAKVAAIARSCAEQELSGGLPWRVEGVIILRATRRNGQLVREFNALFASHFPASSHAWLAALTRNDRAMPDQPGFLWTNVRGTRLVARRQ
jgi:transcriptional regulator with XRE-family HTH domain